MPQENGESGESDKGTLKCQLCGLIATSAESFSEHIKKAHGDITSLIGEDVALRPMQPIRPAETRSKRNKIHRCKQCNFESPTKELHWKHCSTHIREDKRLHCPKCAFVTEYKHHLEYHVRNHYGSKPFHCTKCSYTCVSKSMLKSHMKSHLDKLLYYCNDCNYHSKDCHSMKQHTVLHKHTSTTPLSLFVGTNAAPAANPDEKSSATEELNLTRCPRNQGKSCRRGDAVAQTSQFGNKPQPAMNAASLPMFPLKLSPSVPKPLMMLPFGQFYNMQLAQMYTANAAAACFNPSRHSGIHNLFPQTPSSSDPTTFATSAPSRLELPPPNYSSSLPSLGSMTNGTSPNPFFGASATSMAFQAKSNMATTMFSPSTGGETPLLGMPLVFSPQFTAPMPSALQRLSAENESSSSHPLDLSTVRTPDEDSDIMALRRRSHKGKAYRVDSQSVASAATITSGSKGAWLGAASDHSPHTFSPNAGLTRVEEEPLNYKKNVATSESSEGSCENVKSSKEMYSCQYCEIQFKDCVMYSMHKGYHGYENPLKCNMCGAECDNKLSFFLHIGRSAHP